MKKADNPQCWEDNPQCWEDVEQTEGSPAAVREQMDTNTVVSYLQHL